MDHPAGENGGGEQVGGLADGAQLGFDGVGEATGAVEIFEGG